MAIVCIKYLDMHMHGGTIRKMFIACASVDIIQLFFKRCKLCFKVEKVSSLEARQNEFYTNYINIDTSVI